MKKSQLRNIIKGSIKGLLKEQSLAPSGIIPLISDGSSWSHFSANICPAKFAMHHTGLPIEDIGNYHWLNQQYTLAGIPTLPGTPNSGATHTQMFSCFQVHPVAEQWWQPPNPGVQYFSYKL